MVNSTVVCGSGVYCNGLAMTIISATLMTVRRNGFRPVSLTTGERISHRGTSVLMSDNCLVIKGGKPVHVLNPERIALGRTFGAERYTIDKGKTTRVNPLQCLVGGSMSRITSTLCFDYHWFDNETYELTVIKRSTKKPIGYHEF